MIDNLDSLQSISLIIKNQVFSLDVNFSGLFKILPQPTLESLEEFSEITPPEGVQEVKKNPDTEPLLDTELIETEVVRKTEREIEYYPGDEID